MSPIIGIILIISIIILFLIPELFVMMFITVMYLLGIMAGIIVAIFEFILNLFKKERDWTLTTKIFKEIFE